ncbi:MAG TPA: MFS transporter [Anaerolineales bacterium]|nr:MFS transporter [Anaerolineales bacterium]
MIAALRQRNFALLWLGGFISMTGDMVLYVALPYHVYQLTGSALSTGLMFIVENIPRVLLGSVAGVFVDRWNRKQIMIVASIIQGLCILFLLLAKSIEWLWIVYLVSFVESVIARFFYPAQNALLPNLVSEKNLFAANSLNAINDNVSMLTGSAIGAVLFRVWGLTGIVFLDCASFFVAAIMIAFIAWSPNQTQHEPFRVEIAETTKASTAAWKSVWREWLEGLRLIRSNQMIVALFVSVGIACLGGPILEVLLVPYVSILKGGVLVLGWLLIVRGMGGLLGGFLTGKMSGKLNPILTLSLALGGTGLLGLIMYNVPSLYVALACLFLIGVVIVLGDVSYLTLFQTNIIDQFRGRVFGAMGTTFGLLNIIGQITASILGDHVGIIPILNMSGILYILSGLVAFLMITKAISNKQRAA